METTQQHSNHYAVTKTTNVVESEVRDYLTFVITSYNDEHKTDIGSDAIIKCIENRDRTNTKIILFYVYYIRFADSRALGIFAKEDDKTYVVPYKRSYKLEGTRFEIYKKAKRNYYISRKGMDDNDESFNAVFEEDLGDEYGEELAQEYITNSYVELTPELWCCRPKVIKKSPKVSNMISCPIPPGCKNREYLMKSCEDSLKPHECKKVSVEKGHLVAYFENESQAGLALHFVPLTIPGGKLDWFYHFNYNNQKPSTSYSGKYTAVKKSFTPPTNKFTFLDGTN